MSRFNKKLLQACQLCCLLSQSDSPFSQHLRCCMLWPVFLISMMVGHHCHFGEPFALMTCSKYEQFFSKWNFVIAKKWRTTAVNCCARNRCRTKLLTQPPYQIEVPSTSIEVEREVFVYGCIHNRITLKLFQYSLKNVCLAICLKLVHQNTAHVTLSHIRYIQNTAHVTHSHFCGT